MAARATRPRIGLTIPPIPPSSTARICRRSPTIPTFTITTATTEVRTLNISGIVRVTYGEGFGALTLVNSGVAITTSNVEIDVEDLG